MYTTPVPVYTVSVPLTSFKWKYWFRKVTLCLYQGFTSWWRTAASLWRAMRMCRRSCPSSCISASSWWRLVSLEPKVGQLPFHGTMLHFEILPFRFIGDLNVNIFSALFVSSDRLFLSSPQAKTVFSLVSPCLVAWQVPEVSWLPGIMDLPSCREYLFLIWLVYSSELKHLDPVRSFSSFLLCF